jgi:hypothetical protein
MLRRVVWYKLADVSEVLMMEAVSTSETSISFYQTTRRNIPGDGHLHGYETFVSIKTGSFFVRLKNVNCGRKPL